MKNKGITLIALVITIIVLLILAGVTINLTIGENGIIRRAQQATIKQAQAAKEEEVSFAIANLLMEHQYDKSKITVSEVVEEVRKNYESQAAKDSISGTSTVEEDKFPGAIQYDKPSSTINQAIIVQVDENLNVTSNITEPTETLSPPASTYTSVNGIFYNTPDLSGFDKSTTYYIAYDSAGENEKLYGRIDAISEPEGDDVWHDYKNKVWANVVSVNGDEVAYWVWIPRYKYKVDATGKTVDVKFVDENDECKEMIDEKETIIDVSDYELPESFKFGNKNLKGYWISKYEVQNADSISREILHVITDKGEATLTTTNPSGTVPSGLYTVFLNGVKYKEHVTLPKKLSELEITQSYDIVLVKEGENKVLGSTKGRIQSNIEVDLSGFDQETTYYVTYDEDGNNESIYGRIDGTRPDNWYDYENKIWANVVSVNGDEVAYWTYIPRYEYKVVPGNKYVDVRYIPVSQKEPDKGYIIPESFKFGGQELKGFWISKYEVQKAESITTKEVIQIITENGEIEITTTNPSGTYTLYIDNKTKKTGVTLPCKLSELGITSDYEIMVIKEEGNKILGNVNGMLNYKIEVDLSGFDKTTTYYVTYDENGNNEQVCDKPISEMEEPTNWYSYEKKIWANIKSENKETGEIAYWTYIPRYEYRVMPGGKYVDVRYIPVTQKEPDKGYIIPESFTFGGQDLKGFWISKYEVQKK